MQNVIMGLLMSPSTFSLCVIHICVLLVVDTQASYYSSHSNKGRAFHMSFLTTSSNCSYNGLVITSNIRTAIFIYLPSNSSLVTHTVPTDRSLHLQLPCESAKRQAVSVYSLEPVAVYGVTSEPSSVGVYTAIPVDKWGDHYITATYNGDGGEIVIISAEDKTSVSVKLNVEPYTRCIIDERMVSFSSQFVFILNKEEVLRITCSNDLTGSEIRGSSPIGVISGQACNEGAPDTSDCRHLVEMMIPTSHLGKEFIIAALAGRNSRLRAVYVEKYAGMTNMIITPIALSKPTKTNRLFREFVLQPDSIVRLTSNYPVLVVLYLLGSADSRMLADPAMSIVAPIDRFDSNLSVPVDWSSLTGHNAMQFHIDVYTARNESHLKSDIGMEVTKENAYEFKISHASISNKTILVKDLFAPASNIIVAVSNVETSAAYPAGMRMEFFAGTDICSANLCPNNGICYSHGNKTLCFYADQLSNNTTKISESDPPVYISVSETTPSPPPVRKLCSCTCENATSEDIEQMTEDIEEELKVDVKTTHKTIHRYQTTYDTRVSAAGIGILGIIFLSLPFGSIVLLDLISAMSYIAGWLKNYQESHKAKAKANKVKNYMCSSALPITPVQYKETNQQPTHSEDSLFSQSRKSIDLSTHDHSPTRVEHYSRSLISMPRLQVSSDQVLVVGQNGEAFKMRRPSWSLKQNA